MILNLIKKRHDAVINKLLLTGVLLIFFAWYISAFWYQLMLLQGSSMEPAYHSGQFLILDKHSGSFSYNDVIAIKKDIATGFLVKRIVGVPGDIVYIDHGVLYINDEPKEEWQEEFEYAGIAAEPVVLDEGYYFVLGDNIGESKDSRNSEIGLIKETEIKGKVLQFQSGKVH